MNSKPYLLILDDEKEWLDRHFKYFRNKDFICIPTLFSDHAIYLCSEVNSIKYAIIDEVLLTLKEPKENQRWQGQDVIREIAALRRDIKFVMITKKMSRNDPIEKMRDFQDGSLGLNVEYLCKDEFDNSSDRSYQRIKTIFEKSNQKIAIESTNVTVQEKDTQSVTKILFLAANPKDQNTLNLGAEVRNIDEALRSSSKRDQFKLEHRWAVSHNELRCALLDIEPDFVHFCGHGLGIGGLVLEDRSGQTQLISTTALAGLLEMFVGKIKCVVLSACFTEEQAKAIVEHVDFVVGMRSEIGEAAAKSFSEGFYDALLRGRTVEEAFKFGRNAISESNILETEIPVLLKKKAGKSEGE